MINHWTEACLPTIKHQQSLHYWEAWLIMNHCFPFMIHSWLIIADNDFDHQPWYSIMIDMISLTLALQPSSSMICCYLPCLIHQKHPMFRLDLPWPLPRSPKPMRQPMRRPSNSWCGTWELWGASVVNSGYDGDLLVYLGFLNRFYYIISGFIEILVANNSRG